MFAQRIIRRRKLHIDPSTARSRISNVKAQGMSYSEYVTQASKKKNVETQEFAMVYEEYEEALAKSNLLDYDNLLLRCVELLKQHPSCVSNVEAVLIDEFQDTNLVQFDLMRLFAAYRKRVTIVGDPYVFQPPCRKFFADTKSVTRVFMVFDPRKSRTSNACRGYIRTRLSSSSKRIIDHQELSFSLLSR
jgi:ATP-dependent exoDNAse (exonuclease V) beta subunit